jgi:hypothetical protein
VSAPPEPKAKSRRPRFRVRTGLGAIALVGLVLALLDAWIRAPYRAERRAAVALTRLGGKVVMVDHAPRWLRQYVSDKLLDMSVAATVDLSHSRVKGADLVHVRSFQHFGALDLSDTEVGNAGLEHLRTVVGSRFIDLSRTRVTDTSALFGPVSYRDHASGVKLSGNRIAGGRLFPFEKQWCPLQELDLSRTDIDDRTLKSLPEGLVNLSRLDLSGTVVTDGGLDSLSKLEGLATLDLRDTRVTPAGVARLKAGWRGWRPLTVLSGRLKGPPGIIIWGSTAPKPPQPAKRPKRGVRPTAPEA